jgi:hypothetical protein
MPVVQLKNVVFCQYQNRHFQVKIQPQFCSAGVFKIPYSWTTKVKWKNDSILIMTECTIITMNNTPHVTAGTVTTKQYTYNFTIHTNPQKPVCP